MQVVEDRLIACEAGTEIQREIIVWLTVVVVEGITVEEVEGEERLMLATEDATFIS